MATQSPSPSPEQPVRLVPRPEERAAGPDPAMVALPSFIVGSVALGMVLIQVVPATAVGASMPILIAAAAGMFLATIWAARVGQNAAAGIDGVFGSFFLSYALLVLGLTHNWYGIPLTSIADTQKVFVISWLVIVTMLVLASVRLPIVYGLLFLLIDASLLLNLLSIIQTSTNLSKAAGWVLMAVAATIVYLFLGSASRATGGRELPLGPAILHA
jgi:uncharacterized protein